MFASRTAVSSTKTAVLPTRPAVPAPHTGNQALLRKLAPLPSFPHGEAIARAFGLSTFDAPAALDPTLGSEAVTQHGQVRFARWPSLEVAAHEAAHIVQTRGGAAAGAAGAERHAGSVAGRVRRGMGAADLLRPGVLIGAPIAQAHGFVPAGDAPATHAVVAGDTLESIAKDVYGNVRYANAIQLANPALAKPNPAGGFTLTPGDVLKLPEQPDAADPWVNPYVSKLLRAGGSWTLGETVAALDAFAAQPEGTRDAMIANYLPYNNLTDMLSTIPVSDAQAGGKYEAKVRDMLQRIQRVGAKAMAAKEGMANEDAMAQAQADMMTARNTAAAAKALPPKAAPPTPAQIAAQQKNQVAQGSIAPQTGVMTPAQAAAINDTLNKKTIPDFVSWATANHPELKITAARFKADALAIFNRGEGIVAAADSTGLRALVGQPFVDMVTANPAYALSTVVHEVWGHHTYEGEGNYGDPGSSYGLDIYDKAAAKMPGYKQPTGDDRTRELDNFGYHETEMYAEMREIDHFTPNAPADEPKLGSMNYAPAPEVLARIKSIVKAFEPKVAVALLHGLCVRFRADPTISVNAFTVFTNGIRTIMSAADASAIID